MGGFRNRVFLPGPNELVECKVPATVLGMNRSLNKPLFQGTQVIAISQFAIKVILVEDASSSPLENPRVAAFLALVRWCRRFGNERAIQFGPDNLS